MSISSHLVDLSPAEIVQLTDPVASTENIFEPAFEISLAVVMGLKKQFAVSVEYEEALDGLVFQESAIETPTQTNFIGPGSSPLSHAESLFTRVVDDLSVQVERFGVDSTTWKIQYGMSLTAVAGGDRVGTGFFLSIHATFVRR